MDKIRLQRRRRRSGSILIMTYNNEKLGRDLEFYFGRVGKARGSRRKGDRFVGLADITSGYYTNLLALTYKEIATGVAAGTLLGVAIPIARSLLGM